MWSILCPKCGAVLPRPSGDDDEQICALCGERVELPGTAARPPIEPNLTIDDALIFHALRLKGRETCTLPYLFHLTDACYRHVPSAERWEDGLNRLLAAGLIEEIGGEFSIPDEVARAVDELGPIGLMPNDQVVRFVLSRGPLATIARRIRVREGDYEAIQESSQRIWETERNIRALTEAIQQDPHNGDLFRRRADCYRAIGDRANVARDIRRAEDWEPTLTPPSDKDQFFRDFAYESSIGQWEGKGRMHVTWWGDRVEVWVEADEAGPSDRQLADLRAIAAYDGDLRRDFERDVSDYYSGYPDDMGYHPDLTHSSQIWELLDPATLVVLPAEDPLVFLLIMGCSWDEEHGLGVRFENWSIVDVGHQVDVYPV